MIASRKVKKKGERMEADRGAIVLYIYAKVTEEEKVFPSSGSINFTILIRNGTAASDFSLLLGLISGGDDNGKLVRSLHVPVYYYVHV